LQVLAGLAASKRYSMGTINNESLELNRYRIRKFELTKYFTFFCSSCFFGVLKPAAAIYLMALELTGRAPGECVFIDDREENLDCPHTMGMHVVHYESPARLREELEKYGVGN
jgi:putative hydrolase of the HAD superfamily